MHRTARRRAQHHVEPSTDPDPADLRARAGSLARALVPLVAGCPDALSAERVVSDLAAGWNVADTVRVVQAIELEERDDTACAALHALAWTLRSPDAAALAELRAADGQRSPPWAADLGGWEPTAATGTLHGADRLAFVTFAGAEPHVLAVGTFGGRRARLGLLRPGTGLEAAPRVALGDAARLLETALGESTTLCGDGGPDLRHLARRRLEVLRDG